MRSHTALAEPPAPSGQATTSSRWPVRAAIVTVLLLWASAFIAIRALADTLSPGPFALGRVAIGSLALGVLALRRRRPLPRGRALVMVAAYGVLWFAAYNVVLNAAGHHLDAGTSAMLVNIAPILVAIGAGVFLAEGFPRRLLLGIGIAFAGVVLIAAGTNGDGEASRLGLLLGVTTALLYATGVLTQKVALRSVDVVTATWLGCTIGAISLLPFLPQAVRELSVASPGALAAVVYLGVFPTAVAFTLWAYALSRTDAGRLTSLSLTIPAITVAMSWLILGEVPSLLGIIGGTVCLVGVAVGQRRPRTTAPPIRPSHP